MPVERAASWRRAGPNNHHARTGELSELEDAAGHRQADFRNLVADATSRRGRARNFSAVPRARLPAAIPLGGDWAYTVRIPLGVVSASARGTTHEKVAAWKAAPGRLSAGTPWFFQTILNKRLY